MRKSVVGKIFLSISLLLMLLLCIQLFVQNLYFEDLYHSIKEDHIESYSKSIMNSYDRNGITAVLGNNIREYSQMNNAAILMVNDSGNILNQNFFSFFDHIKIKIVEGIYVYVLIDFLTEQDDQSVSESFHKDDLIYIKGIKIKNTDYIEAVEIWHDFSTYINASTQKEWKEYYHSNFSTLELIGGTIEEVHMTSDEDVLLPYLHKKLWKHVKKVFRNNEFESFIENNRAVINDRQKGMNTIIKLIPSADRSDLFCFTIYEEEHPRSFFWTMNKYYILLYFMGFIVILLLAYFYSRWISRPLLEINENAKRIANLDFTAESDVHTGDEIEQLSRSLNVLSRNLKKSIEQLEESNSRLSAEAKRKAEDEEKIRKLLLNVSHEFKTPLAIISGFLEIVKNRLHEKDPEYYLDVIGEEVDDLNKLVLETLELSKIEFGITKPDYSNFNIRTSIEKICFSMQREADRKNLGFAYHICDLYVYGDYEKIQRVLLNFISNAVQYSDGSGLIHIGLEELQEEILISIKNKGVPIAEDERNKIWDPYFRTDRAKAISKKGTGLGLAITKNILDLHNSRYGVRVHEDTVEFYFTLEKGSDPF